MLTCRAVTIWCFLLIVYFAATSARDEYESQQDLRDSSLNFRLPRSPQRQRNTPRPGRARTPRPARPSQTGANRRLLEMAGRVGAANTFFAAKLFSALFPQLTANTIISPHSVHTALSMLMLGAKRATETELFSALGLRQSNVPKSQIHRAYQALLTALSRVHETVTVVNANAVFVRPGISLQVPFRNGLQQQYNASFDHIKFDDPNGPEAPINAWVSNKTRGKITDLLAPGTLTQQTSLVLLNAIFFNATWNKPFNSGLTGPRPFHSLNNGVQSVDTMQNSGFYNYSNHRGAEVVELPFKGDRLSMFILLPNENSSIDLLRQELSNTRRHGFNPIQIMLDNLEATNIKLYLPKFKIESSSISLKDPLQSLGITRIFTAAQAELSGISSAPLVVDDVLHKAVIDVNEQGCEAAAATAILIARTSFIRESREVKVDRPFVYLIQDKGTKAILFMGAYVGQQA